MQAEFIDKPMPSPRLWESRLSDAEKANIDSMEVGSCMRFKDGKAAQCAITRIRNAGRKTVQKKNPDGTVDVWRAS